MGGRWSIRVETSWHAALEVYSPLVEHFEDLTLRSQQAGDKVGKGDKELEAAALSGPFSILQAMVGSWV